MGDEAEEGVPVGLVKDKRVFDVQIAGVAALQNRLWLGGGQFFHRRRGQPFNRPDAGVGLLIDLQRCWIRDSLFGGDEELYTVIGPVQRAAFDGEHGFARHAQGRLGKSEYFFEVLAPVGGTKNHHF